MMYKKLFKILIFILLINIFIPFKESSAAEKKLLILNDGYKSYGQKINILQEIIKTSISMNYEVEATIYENSNNINFNNYDFIIVLKNDYIDFSNNTMDEIMKYKDKILLVLNSDEEIVDGIKDDVKEFIDLSNLDEDLKLKSIQDFMYNNLYNTVSKNNKYLILDEMYLIDDLNDAIKKIDYLYNLGIPFIISSMPIFSNTDIEAVQRYCEVLRYAQSKGGSIILHFPDINKEDSLNINMDSLINKMKISYDSLINYKVYPRAIDIPEELLYHERINNYLELTDTLFLDINTNKINLSKDNIKLISMNNLIEKIPYDKFDKERSYKSNIGIAITANIEFNTFKDILQLLEKREVYFNDLSYLDTSFSIGENQIKSENSNLYLNNKNVTVQRFISREEFKSMFSNEENIKEEVSIDLSNFNKVLIVITSVASLIFIIIAIRSRKIDRDKFFK